jgi:hypothetical protein
MVSELMAMVLHGQLFTSRTILVATGINPPIKEIESS